MKTQNKYKIVWTNRINNNIETIVMIVLVVIGIVCICLAGGL